MYHPFVPHVHLDPQNVPVNREAYANYANERPGNVVQAVKGISTRIWFGRTSVNKIFKCL